MYKKTCTLSLSVPIGQYEWGTWADRQSPHCRLVWRSQFPGLLHKFLWYALTHEGLQANMRSLMWGVGCKNYPRQRWVCVLGRFWGAHALHGVISLQQMFLWPRSWPHTLSCVWGWGRWGPWGSGARAARCFTAPSPTVQHVFFHCLLFLSVLHFCRWYCGAYATCCA